MREVVDRARQLLDDVLRAPANRPSSSGTTSGAKFICVTLPDLFPTSPRKRGGFRRLPWFASASMAVTGNNGQADSNDEANDDSPYMKLGPTLAIGTRGRKRGVVLTDPAELNELRERLASLTPEQREDLRLLAHQQVLNSVKTKDGKPLYDEAMAALKELEARECGVGLPTMRQLPRYQQDMLIRPEKLRPGAEKMQLRKWEEDEMELEFMGNGNVFSPAPLVGMMFGGQRDFAYGLYANTRRVPDVLGTKWANIEQSKVIQDPEFYHDIINRGPSMELTLMLIPSRDLPVSEAISKLRPRMEECMSELKSSKTDAAALNDFLNMFDAPYLKGAPFLEEGPTLKQGTRLIFTCGDEGQTITEAINPGKIKHQRMIPVSNIANCKVTYSLFNSFIGDRALDPVAKQSVGKGMSYIANGFSFHASENRNQVLVDDPNAPVLDQLQVEEWRNTEEVLRPSQTLFRFLGGKKDDRGMLLQGIHDWKSGRKARPARVAMS